MPAVIDRPVGESPHKQISTHLHAVALCERESKPLLWKTSLYVMCGSGLCSGRTALGRGRDELLCEGGQVMVWRRVYGDSSRGS